MHYCVTADTDDEQQSNYSETYDVFSTPKLFVVDGDRKFIGKSLSPDQIVDLVKKLKERKAKKG